MANIFLLLSMSTTDTLTRFLFESAPVRGELVSLDATWQEVLKHADYPAPLQILLGELMAAAALLSAILKFDGGMIMQMQGNGAVKLIVVEATSDRTLRAAAKWEGEVPTGSLEALLGEGRFVITLDQSASGKQNYQGIVPLTGSSVAEALTHYMQNSEQLDTQIHLAANTQRAAGMLIQRLPGVEAADTDAWNRAEHLAATLKPAELLTLPAETILQRLFHEEDVRVLEAELVSYRCTCSRERVADMLKMLGREEVEAALAERGEIEVRCEFCNRQYRFDPVDAAQLFVAVPPVPAPQIKH
ncbi:MAG: Hsp33 family molecular chaperone HslO [Sulfuriferula sp.]